MTSAATATGSAPAQPVPQHLRPGPPPARRGPGRLGRLAWGLGWAAASLQAGAQVLPLASGGALPTDRLIIKYRAGTAAARQPDLQTMGLSHAAANRAGVQLSHRRTVTSGAHVMQMDRRLPADAARRMAALIAAADASVEYAEPDLLLQPLAVPNDPGWLPQWQYHEALGGINLPAAWNLGSTGVGVVVAVVDSGWRPHADLSANIVGGHDFISNAFVGNDGDGRDTSALDPGDAVAAGECGTGSPAFPSSWHGTHVAGTIAAVTNNGLGVSGVAPGARLLPVRVLGRCGAYTSDIADGVVWAAGGSVAGVPVNAYPARVLNLSLGGTATCATTLQTAINTARARGAVVVVAAGNESGAVANSTPANCSGVVAVAATDRSGARAYYSNFGNGVTVAAPGGDMRAAATNGIRSTWNTGPSAPGADGYAWAVGTSMAAPHVAGVAALMLSAKPTLTTDQVISLLKSSARAFPAACSGCGAGIIDAGAAVAAARSFIAPSPPPVRSIAVLDAGFNDLWWWPQVLSGGSAFRVSGSIATAVDVDWYQVPIGAGAAVTATLQAATNAGNADLAAYSLAGLAIASSNLGPGQADVLKLKNNGSTASAFLLRVQRGNGGTATSFGYMLSITAP